MEEITRFRYGRRHRGRDGEPPKQVNPLKSKFLNMRSNVPEDWLIKSMAVPNQPTVVDIGCGVGEWILAAASAHPNWNFVGFDIREGAFAHAQQKALSIPNATFIAGNVLAGDMAALFNDICNEASLYAVFVQYPDPNWKKRKRQMCSLSLLQTVSTHLNLDGYFCFRSDVQDVCKMIQSLVESDLLLKNSLRCLLSEEVTSMSETLPFVPEVRQPEPRALIQQTTSERAPNLDAYSDETSTVLAQQSNNPRSFREINKDTAYDPNGSKSSSGTSISAEAATSEVWPLMLNIPTERELYVRRRGGSIYTLVYRLETIASTRRSLLSSITAATATEVTHTHTAADE